MPRDRLHYVERCKECGSPKRLRNPKPILLPRVSKEFSKDLIREVEGKDRKSRTNVGNAGVRCQESWLYPLHLEHFHVGVGGQRL